MYFSSPLNFVMDGFLVASVREGAHRHRTTGGGDFPEEDRRKLGAGSETHWVRTRWLITRSTADSGVQTRSAVSPDPQSRG